MQDSDSEATAQDSSDQEQQGITEPQQPNNGSSSAVSEEAPSTTIPTTTAAAAAAYEEDPEFSTTNNIDTDNNNYMTTTTTTTAGSTTDLNQRAGTTASARFNILSTMVGGGSLSLPLAFQLTGNAVLGPILLIVVAAITEFCFRTLVASARTLSPVAPNQTAPGKDSFESIAYAAFGTKAYLLSTALVVAMCFFGIVGYAVLLRDMLQPISDVVFHATMSGPTAANNATMFVVVLLVTPLCTLKTLTALKRFGAASMVSVLILGCCVVYRSLECNLGLLFGEHDTERYNWRKTFQLWPHSWKQVLDAFPLYVSCFVCHYNILTVHNELRHPTVPRVGWWLRSTTWIACAFYMMIGVAGSAYGACTPTGKVHGNVLLDFSDSDPLLLVGRMCLALTITLAFPMLTIPARDIIIRSLPLSVTTCLSRSSLRESANNQAAIEEAPEETLQEPLLSNDDEEEPIQSASAAIDDSNSNNRNEPLSVMAPLWLRLVVAIFFFWSAALVASCVASIDIVWDLLGSSLSILLSHLIPCGSYLVIQRQQRDESSSSLRAVSWKKRLSVRVAWLLIAVFVPLMVASTANAVYNTFFAGSSMFLF